MIVMAPSHAQQAKPFTKKMFIKKFNFLNYYIWKF